MKAKRFDDIVKARADARVQAKIKVFRKEVNDSCTKLLGGYIGTLTIFQNEEDFLNGKRSSVPREILIQVLCINSSWPAQLWKDETERVQKELLATMDEMQLALRDFENKEEPEFKMEAVTDEQ